MRAPTGKLLVVDDNEMNRDMLSRRLAKQGHAVKVAEEGTRALERIEQESFDLILLDIMMPGIDGFEVLKRLRERHEPGDLPVIMATAKSESGDVVAALRTGANDYVTKPFDFPVVSARVRTQLELKRSREELAEAHRRMKSDLEAAARIQQTLLPSDTLAIEGARAAWRYVPCDELAGDTLNVVTLDERMTGLFVLDVSGHGVPSSLLSVTLSRLLSGTRESSSALWRLDPGSDLPRVATPVEVLDELSRRFPYDDDTRQYFTLVYGILDTDRGRFTYASAGHPPVAHLRRGSVPSFHGSTGPPIALLPPIVGPSKFEQATIAVEPGDRLYLYSDAVPEALNPEGEQFGEERLAETLKSLPDEELDRSISVLLDRVWEWGGDKGPDDDVSVVAVDIAATRSPSAG